MGCATMCYSEQGDEDQCTWVQSFKTPYFSVNILPLQSVPVYDKKRHLLQIQDISVNNLKSGSTQCCTTILYQFCSYYKFYFDLHMTEVINLLPSDPCCLCLSACLIVCLKNPCSFCHCSLTVNQQWSKMAQNLSKVLTFTLMSLGGFLPLSGKHAEIWDFSAVFIVHVFIFIFVLKQMMANPAVEQQ